ncbi:hypothetical protein TNIN_366761 [Trichonephila inaurata madagascariensis]|uniref:Uncharacterized protein n=1 Tax=Trichonephila inaurata madagascariensis TaxID=2747483 RepID=A0A8X7CE66_9ARAC|nr:hypothetical protein TNIN_366761 [Trichonephila inaurata madagascariensis]
MGWPFPSAANGIDKSKTCVSFKINKFRIVPSLNKVQAPHGSKWKGPPLHRWNLKTFSTPYPVHSIKWTTMVNSTERNPVMEVTLSGGSYGIHPDARESADRFTHVADHVASVACGPLTGPTRNRQPGTRLGNAGYGGLGYAGYGGYGLGYGGNGLGILGGLGYARYGF